MKKAAQGPRAQRLSAAPSSAGTGRDFGHCHRATGPAPHRAAAAPPGRPRTEQHQAAPDSPTGRGPSDSRDPELCRPGQALTSCPSRPRRPRPSPSTPPNPGHLLGIRAAREPSLQPAHNFQHRLRHFYYWTGRSGGSGFTSHSPHGASRPPPPPPSWLRAGSGSCVKLPPSAAAKAGEGRARWVPSWGLAWRWRVRHLECWQSAPEGQRGSRQPRSARSSRQLGPSAGFQR